MSGKKQLPAIERFWKKVEKTDTCWIWKGAKNKSSNGYGMLNVNNRNIMAHRFAYEKFVGGLKPGMSVDHLCRIRTCVNPEHLEPVTQRENVLRGAQTKKVYQFTRDGKFVKEHRSTSDAAISVGRTPSPIACAARGETKTSAGYKWYYESDEVIDLIKD